MATLYKARGSLIDVRQLTPTPRNAAYLDLTTWGWVHIVVGVLVVLADFGVLSGNVLARTVGAILAAHGRELVNR